MSEFVERKIARTKDANYNFFHRSLSMCLVKLRLINYTISAKCLTVTQIKQSNENEGKGKFFHATKGAIKHTIMNINL